MFLITDILLAEIIQVTHIPSTVGPLCAQLSNVHELMIYTVDGTTHLLDFKICSDRMSEPRLLQANRITPFLCKVLLHLNL